MNSIRTRTRRLIAVVCLTALAFAQVVAAAHACFGSRVAVSGEGCAMERLLCYAHCQAEEEASGGAGAAIPDPAGFPPVPYIAALVWAPSVRPAATFVALDPEPVRPPPPFSVNLRLLN